MDRLAQTLKKTFGYSEFRPLQREIIETSLAGRDVFALLPTGGGKSLCFQLPALLREGLTIVVSPLIALMKDQVDQLDAVGVPATFLNSSLGVKETKARLHALHEGRYRLLYAAPERLMLDHWKENLLTWPVSAIAIDEAHCISEWGHDFRPEYRQLSRLRTLLPDVPVMALTATATGRVRSDIVQHLKLREPEIFVASFNRPNLSYRVEPKTQAITQIHDFVRRRPLDSGIVYCATRATAERVAQSLEDRGHPAKPYHAGLTPSERALHQELFLRDEARIICATIAFGMGINKPNVRWVIHHDLPKNLEGYYQETGRAGRDGLPSDCLLLFNVGDAAKQSHFIEEISNPLEKKIAREQLDLMIRYAESAGCRRREVLAYFGEDFPATCGNCDNCISPRESYNATTQAQKFLSCVYRVRQAGRFGVGMNHIIEILTGAETDKIRRWGHQHLSTYGIGKDLTRPQWGHVCRELLRVGYLAMEEGEFPVLALTESGLEALKSRRMITLHKQLAPPPRTKSSERAGMIECDEALFERLRRLRKRLADERQVPAYVILGDVTLRLLARDLPDSMDAISGVSGFGEKKSADFGSQFLEEIADHLKTYPRLRPS